jgi:hypothetical protein
MKKTISSLAFVCMMVLVSAPVFAGAQAEFIDAYEELSSTTNELFEGLGEGLEGTVPDVKNLVKKTDILIAKSNTMEKASEKLGLKNAAKEAGHMAEYLGRIRDSLKTGKEKHAIIMMAARYYKHFNNCLTNNPVGVQMLLQDHIDEIKEAVESEDKHEIEHLAEHLHIHADQMYYAAILFGKKVWQKFAVQAKEAADKIHEATESGDFAGVKEGITEIEKPVAMLKKLVK